jgi:predicted nuclease of predicted toxin-antitoxin system
MLAFYMDHQIRASLTRGLRQRNIDVLTALDDGADTLPDDLLLARATELGRVLVTHDKGFLKLASSWVRTGRSFTGIVFAVQNTLQVGKAIEYLELIAIALPPVEIRSRVEHIPSRL